MKTVKFFQRILLGAVLFLGLSAQAYLPGSSFPAPTLDYNFTASSFYQPATPACVSAATCLTTTRSTTAYADDLNGLWSLFAINTPRITNKGLLVEEPRTNSVRNNSMQGAVAGSPGTLPTNWLSSGPTSTTVIAVGVENGIDYVDLRLQGTSAFSILLDITTQVAATAGQTWSGSFFTKLVSGSLTNLTIVNRIAYRTSGGALVTNNDVTSTPTATFQRSLSNTFTAVGGTIAAVDVQVTGLSTGAYDITIRIGWPQLELGASVTSPIRTTNAAVARAADVVTVTTPPTFGSAYTLFGKGTPNAPTTFNSNQRLITIDDGTVNNIGTLLRTLTTGTPQGNITVGGTSQGIGTGPVVWGQNSSGKEALASSAADQVFVFNNGTVFSRQMGQIAPTAIRVGANTSGASFWNGYIERATIWNSRLNNEQLRRLTAP